MRPTPTNVITGDVDLFISPPVDTPWVLGLYQWLRANAEVNEVAVLRDGDTVVSVTFREPIHIHQILAELPDIAEVAEERHTDDSETFASSSGEFKFDMLRPVPTRFRLALKLK